MAEERLFQYTIFVQYTILVSSFSEFLHKRKVCFLNEINKECIAPRIKFKKNKRNCRWEQLRLLVRIIVE